MHITAPNTLLLFASLITILAPSASAGGAERTCRLWVLKPDGHHLHVECSDRKHHPGSCLDLNKCLGNIDGRLVSLDKYASSTLVLFT
jgi:hypothetical protein